MAKVRCARCGNIFALQSGEIQLCPQCGCRMRVNLPKPQPTAPVQQAPVQAPVSSQITEEYENLRREYMEVMRERIAEQREKKEGVYLSTSEYKELVEKASRATNKVEPVTSAPVTNFYVTPTPIREEKVAPVVEPAKALPEEPVAPAIPEPISEPSESHTMFDEYNDEDEGKDEPIVTKKKVKGTGFSWFAFLFALSAGVMSALLLVFDIFKVESAAVTGMEITFNNFIMPASLIMIAIIFLPALLAFFTLIFTATKKKVPKFFLSFLYLIAGVALAISYYLYSVSLMPGLGFSFDLIIESIKLLSIYSYIAVGLCGAASFFLFIAGIVTKKPKKEELFEEEAIDDEEFA